MPITNVQPPKNPGDRYTLGFDTDQNAWVPVDIQAQEGSTIGNLGRAAGRGFESLFLGAGEMGGADNQPAVADLAARTRAAAAGAPIAESVGGFAPEALAGVGAGIATGGLGFLPALGAEALAGGAVTAARPGSFEERMVGALETAGLNIAGGAAAKGILSAIPVVRGLLGATQNRVAAGVEAAGARIDAGRANQAAIENMVPEGGVAPELRAGAQQPGSVGAAQTPAGAIPEDFAQESSALARTEQVGADLSDDRMIQQMRERGQRLGMRESVSFGSRGGSPIRRLRAGLELTPFGDPIDQAVKAHNQGKVANYLARALELPDAETRTSIFADNLDDAKATIGNRFEYVESRMPTISTQSVVDELGKLKQQGGIFGKPEGQKVIDAAIEQAGAHGDTLKPGEFMTDRSFLSERMADFYKDGKTTSGDVLMAALQKLDDIAQQRMRSQGKDRLAAYWQKARKQWQVYMMVNRPGAVNLATGEVNPRTVFNQMRKGKASGGFGERPATGTPERDLYDAVEFQMHNETGEPMTGARALMKGPLGKTIGGGLAGAAVFDVGRRLLD